MYVREFTKADGRKLTLYAREPMGADAPVSEVAELAAVPEGAPLAPLGPRPENAPPNPHLRWHPLRGEWVTYAAYRQGRTFLPPAEFDPLAPSPALGPPTEVPAGPWDVAVFDNRFPALHRAAHDPPSSIVPTAPGYGVCEVVVFMRETVGSLGALPLARVALLLDVWADRTRRLGAMPGIDYVLPFENRGVEVGVTLHHPHGQIYAYPCVPPVPATMNQNERAHFAEHGRSLVGELVARELAADARVIYRGPHAVAFVPACARYPYEVWVAPIAPCPDFPSLAPDVRDDLARALKTVLMKYDALFSRPFPYLMAWYQAPTDGRAHPESQLHAEIFPAYRTRDRLKYLAGTELGAGFWAMDALPEDKADELRRVPVRCEES